MYLSVGEMSKALGITNEAIRHYVQEGIITPHKNPDNNYWEYSSEDFIRLSDVLFYRSVGLSIKEIKNIMNDGISIEEIGEVIKDRRIELTDIIKDAVNKLQQLDEWEKYYATELSMLGKFAVTPMPAEYRRSGYIDESEHIANALRDCFDLDKADWMNLSLSFYYNIAEPEKGMRRYFSFPEDTRLKIGNTKMNMIEEKVDECLMTVVRFSDNAMEMTAPLIEYAKANKIKLQGIVYGREGTNFFQNGVRTGLYRIYAPIETNSVKK